MWEEGRDGAHVEYRERLHAHPLAWAFSLFLTGTLGIAYGRALGPGWGVTTFLVTQLLVSWLLVASAPVVRVDDRVLRAGRARLPRGAAGPVRVLGAEESRRLQGIDADVRAYRCVRSWVRGAVLVPVSDPRDPHPYWLVSTRHPDRLAAALAPDGPGPAVAA